jgi:hypothetical protein
MVQDADRPTIVGRGEVGQRRHFVIPLAHRQYLGSNVALAVDFHGQQLGLQATRQLGELSHVRMAMMKIIDERASRNLPVRLKNSIQGRMLK